MANLRSFALLFSALVASTLAHQCNIKHTVKVGDTCLGILAQYDSALSLKDFYAANPWVDSLCHNLQVGSKVCVSKHGLCAQTVLIKPGTTCQRTADATGIMLQDFYRLNPVIHQPSCDNLIAGQRYCIKHSPEDTYYGGPTLPGRPQQGGLSGADGMQQPPSQHIDDEDCDDPAVGSPNLPSGPVLPQQSSGSDDKDCGEEAEPGPSSFSLQGSPSSLPSSPSSSPSSDEPQSSSAAESIAPSASSAPPSSQPESSAGPSSSGGPSSSSASASASSIDSASLAQPTSPPASSAVPTSSTPPPASSAAPCATFSRFVCPPTYADIPLTDINTEGKLECFYEREREIAEDIIEITTSFCRYDTDTGALLEQTSTPGCDSFAITTCLPEASSPPSSSSSSAELTSSAPHPSSDPTSAEPTSSETPSASSSAPQPSASTTCSTGQVLDAKEICCAPEQQAADGLCCTAPGFKLECASSNEQCCLETNFDYYDTRCCPVDTGKIVPGFGQSSTQTRCCPIEYLVNGSGLSDSNGSLCYCGTTLLHEGASYSNGQISNAGGGAAPTCAMTYEQAQGGMPAVRFPPVQPLRRRDSHSHPTRHYGRLDRRATYTTPPERLTPVEAAALLRGQGSFIWRGQAVRDESFEKRQRDSYASLLRRGQTALIRHSLPILARGIRQMLPDPERMYQLTPMFEVRIGDMPLILDELLADPELQEVEYGNRVYPRSTLEAMYGFFPWAIEGGNVTRST